MFLSTSKPRIFSALGHDTSPPDSEETVVKYSVKVNASRSQDLQDTSHRSTYRKKKLHLLTGAQWTQGPEIHLQQEVSDHPQPVSTQGLITAVFQPIVRKHLSAKVF